MWAGVTARPKHGGGGAEVPWEPPPAWEPEQRLWQAVFARVLLDALGAKKSRHLLGPIRGSAGNTYGAEATLHDINPAHQDSALSVLRSGWWIALAGAAGLDAAVLLPKLRALGLDVGEREPPVLGHNGKPAPVPTDPGAKQRARWDALSPDERRRRTAAARAARRGAARLPHVVERDSRILALLRERGPMLTREMAENIGVPLSTLHYNLDRLRSQGAIVCERWVWRLAAQRAPGEGERPRLRRRAKSATRADAARAAWATRSEEQRRAITAAGTAAAQRKAKRAADDPERAQALRAAGALCFAHAEQARRLHVPLDWDPAADRPCGMPGCEGLGWHTIREG